MEFKSVPYQRCHPELLTLPWCASGLLLQGIPMPEIPDTRRTCSPEWDAKPSGQTCLGALSGTVSPMTWRAKGDIKMKAYRRAYSFLGMIQPSFRSCILRSEEVKRKPSQMAPSRASLIYAHANDRKLLPVATLRLHGIPRCYFRSDVGHGTITKCVCL